ncbi:hypothetical protein [Derxia lacustris]|uniref:hypothetical protein n=1 Tax=Derxia lacustris TaxID=764842 RepID=UPI00111C35C4|nr:hypothetical protein [Derxia lacustris]
MPNTNFGQLIVAARRAAMYLLTVLDCVAAFYIVKSLRQPSSETETIWLVILLLFGFVSALKLIASLAALAWQALWLFTMPHSSRKRQIELFGPQFSRSDFGLCFLLSASKAF